MYFITTKRMLEVCFSAHPNIQYRTLVLYNKMVTHLSQIVAKLCTESGDYVRKGNYNVRQRPELRVEVL